MKAQSLPAVKDSSKGGSFYVKRGHREIMEDNSSTSFAVVTGYRDSGAEAIRQSDANALSDNSKKLAATEKIKAKLNAPTDDNAGSIVQSLRSAWRWWLPPALLALALVVIFRDPFIGDWDAVEYTSLSIQGRPSPLILGRMLFIFFNHALWLVAHGVFGLPPEKAYLLFKVAVIVQSPLAIIAWWALAREVSSSKRTATVAALLLAVSTLFILYGGQVMTEIPFLLLLGVALTIHLRGLRDRRSGLVYLGAALLGLSANLREAALFYALWLVIAPLACGWKLQRRSIGITALAIVLFLLCAFGGFAYWLLTSPVYRGEWFVFLATTRIEQARHPITLDNLRPLLHYFFYASPLVLLIFPFAAAREWLRHRFSPLLALALVGLCANLALIVHYSVTINERYVLSGLPALTPLAADFLLCVLLTRLNARRAFAGSVAVVLLVAAVCAFNRLPLLRYYAAQRALTKDYDARLGLLPRDAVVMAGSQTIGVIYWRQMGKGEWRHIGTGAGWPGTELSATIEAYLGAGQRVFLDADPRWWNTSGWQADETRALKTLPAHFRFRQVAETLYEIRPPNDLTAWDVPVLPG